MTKKIVKQGKRIQYKATHPIYGSDNVFDSWTVLCEVTMDLAEEEAKRRLNDLLIKTIGEISDEMIDTAEEYEP